MKRCRPAIRPKTPLWPIVVALFVVVSCTGNDDIERATSDATGYDTNSREDASDADTTSDPDGGGGDAPDADGGDACVPLTAPAPPSGSYPGPCRLEKYDSSGLLVRFENWSYDGRGRVSRHEVYQTGTEDWQTEPMSWREYEYLSDGRIDSVLHFSSDRLDRFDHVYDSNQLLVLKRHDIGDDGTVDGEEEFLRDACDKKTKRIRRLFGSLSWTREYEYDEQGHLVRIVFYRADGEQSAVREYEYGPEDFVSRKIITNTANETTTVREREFVRDEEGRPQEVKHSTNGGLNFRLEHTYDSAGNRVSTDTYDPEGEKTFEATYSYDCHDQ